MDAQRFSVKDDGFYGAYYKNKDATDKVIIALFGDAVDDRMAVAGAKWLQGLGCNVMAMSPAKKDYSHHNYPLERFEAAIAWLKAQGNRKIGICGASTTGMLALIAATYLPVLTLTIALTPSDFVMEGFYTDKLDGALERPGNNESSVSYKGEPLPYLPFAYRHPTYWQMIQKETKGSGNFISSRVLFAESERLHPVREEEKIKVERIRGKVIFVGAEDDTLWDTCSYIRRMEVRLAALPHECEHEALIYEHGTHFVYPQSMLTRMLPLISGLFVGAAFKSGRQHFKECKQMRIDIDKRLSEAIRAW